MRATLHQLKVFQKVAILMNFTAASKALCLTQPAVSIQIKQLEENLGLPLFEKIGKKLFLTPAGLELSQFCADIFNRFDNMDMLLSTMKGGLEGKFRLAAVTSAKYFTPHLLGAFNKIYPNVELHLEVMNRSQIIQGISNNQYDLAIMGLLPESIPLASHPFIDNPISIIASSSHPLAQQKNIPVKQLINQNFIFRENGSGTRKALEDELKLQGIKLSPSMVLGSSETIKHAVMAGLGISALSRHSITLELATNRLIELDVQGFPLVRSWYMVHHESKKISPIAQTFIDFILSQQEHIENLCDSFTKKELAKN